MIWNLGEIWLALAAAFVLGCIAGSFLYQRLAFSRHAGRQEALVEGITGAVERGQDIVEGAIVGLREAAAGLFRSKPAEEGEATAVEPPAAAGDDTAARAALPASRAPEQAAAPNAVPTPGEIAAGRPPGIVAPRTGEGDDLRRIRGIGESFEARLHALGIFHYDQIAAWSLKEAAWIAIETGAGDRVVRYDWIGQARTLAAETGEPEGE